MLDRSYADFSTAVHAQLARGRMPLHASFELTRRCPLSCRHCYNNLPVGDLPARQRELSLDEHRRLLDELADLSCLWVLYTGGEIFARPDFLDIYDHARGRGFLITLFTSATSVTPALARRLGQARPFSVEITLYGATAATYEAVTRVPGSFQRCLRGVDLLRAEGIPVTLKTVALTLNAHELGAMRALADERGLPFKFDAAISPRLDCSRSPLDVRLTPEQAVLLDLGDPRRAEEWAAFACRSLSEAPADPGRLYQCGAGTSALAIDPYGGLSMCVLSERHKFDLRQGSLREGWLSFLQLEQQRPTTRTTKCTRCRLRPVCGMCPANGELEAGDPEQPVEFLCQMAHLRAAALDVAVPEHGDCAYCPGGSGHDQLLRSAQAVRRAAAGGSGAHRHLPVLVDGPGGCACV